MAFRLQLCSPINWVKKVIFSFLTIQSLLVCTSCLERKKNERPFSTKGNRFKGVLELIYTYVCEPLNVRAKGVFECFITFIDDYLRYGYACQLHRTYEAFENFK